MHNYIPAYCSINFIDQITRTNPIDFVTPENISSAKSHIEIIELILSGLNIKTDCSQKELEEKASGNRFIFQLMKVDRLYSAEKDFKNLTEEPENFFDNVKEPICLFLLTGFDEVCQEFSEITGNYFLSINSNFCNLFDERIETFTKNNNITWDFAKNFIDNHSAIVIADPYLFTKESRIYYESFLKKILPKKLNKPYHVTLIGKDAFSIKRKTNSTNLPELNEINNWIESIRFLFKNSKIEFHIYNDGEFHDRIIITNNTIIASGIGFSMFYDKSSTKDTTWIGFKPFKRVNTNNNNSVLVYKLMKEKLATMKSWISKSEQKNTQNPLLA